ncbi:hypothetical protein POM88_027817 [Heracleum sosnowskyi]|uniref:Uncharacterized protein n=1 Tax=Heracleum sosnowskyi TaxID=360622 RepID=A0AAD8IAX5_9APIA|nr:hypothetical protein POM88_027817 [Heracleum sosnowskyi]
MILPVCCHVAVSVRPRNSSFVVLWNHFHSIFVLVKIDNLRKLLPLVNWGLKCSIPTQPHSCKSCSCVPNVMSSGTEALSAEYEIGYRELGKDAKARYFSKL